MGVVTWAGNYSRVKLKILFQGEFNKASLVWQTQFEILVRLMHLVLVIKSQ